MKNDDKTNVMRILDKLAIPYGVRRYESDGAVSGPEVAAMLGEDPARVFKTLVTAAKSGAHYVFMVPVRCGLDLKRAAAAVGEKSVAMVHSKELLPLTGYIHGGCSPIGMKKQFTTVADSSAARFESIIFSAGRIGAQVVLPLSALARVVPLTTADIASDEP